MDQIVKYNKLNVDHVTFTDPKQNRYGGKTVGVKYKNKTLVLQTPKMYLPYGLSEYQVKDTSGNPTGDVKYSLDMSFNGWNKPGDSSVKTFYKNMKNMDELLLQKGLTNRVAWFKSKSHTREVVEALFSPVVRMSKDRETGETTDKWPPTMKAKLYCNKDGSFKCETYNSAREQVDFLENVTKGCYVQALVSCSGVWFAGGKYGVTWNLKQMIVHPPLRITGYSFLDDDEDVDDVEQYTEKETPASNFVSDDDETEEEVVYEEVLEEVEEVSAPVVEKKKTKKKTVRKPRTKKVKETDSSLNLSAA